MNKNLFLIVVTFLLFVSIVFGAVIDPITDKRVTEDSTFTLNVQSDLEPGNAFYSLTNAPDRMTINDGTGVISWVPHNEDVGEYNVEVKVENETNSADADTKTFKLTVDNNPPSVSSIPSQSVLAGQTFTYNVQSTDEGEGLTYSLTNAPTGMTINSVNGEISFATSEDDAGSYTVTVNSDDGNGGQDSVTLTLKVEVSYCSSGSGDKLEITDINLNDDTFNIFDTVEIDIEVRANDIDVNDVRVEVVLYNLDEDQEIDNWKSDKEDINEDDTQDFTITFDIPNDENIGEDDNYLLYITAEGDDDDGDNQCAQETEDVEITREDDSVIIRKILVTPTTLKCGDTFTISADIENIGASQQDDVYVRITNTELGIDERSTGYDLEDFSDKDNDATARLTLKIPDNAKEGTYQFESIVYFADEDETNSEFFNINLQKCSGVVEEEEETPEEEVCTEKWTCSSWTDCTGNKQTRTCTDLNKCGTNVDKPDEERSCTSGFVPITGGTTGTKTNMTTTILIIGDVVLVILLIIALAVLFRPKRREKVYLAPGPDMPSKVDVDKKAINGKKK